MVPPLYMVFVVDQSVLNVVPDCIQEGTSWSSLRQLWMAILDLEPNLSPQPRHGIRWSCQTPYNISISPASLCCPVPSSTLANKCVETELHLHAAFWRIQKVTLSFLSGSVFLLLTCWSFLYIRLVNICPTYENSFYFFFLFNFVSQCASNKMYKMNAF